MQRASLGLPTHTQASPELFCAVKNTELEVTMLPQNETHSLKIPLFNCVMKFEGCGPFILMFLIVSNYNIVTPQPTAVQAELLVCRVDELPRYFGNISRNELTHISPCCNC